MPLPFILAGAALAAAGYGVKKGLDAKEDIDDAKRYQRWAVEESEDANNRLEDQKIATNDILEDYGYKKKEGIADINLFNSYIGYPNGRMKGENLVDYLKRKAKGVLSVGKKFSEKYPRIIITQEEELEILKKLRIIDSKLSNSQAKERVEAECIEMQQWGTAVLALSTGSLAGLAAGGGAYLGVGALAAASTGTAISSLSGVAATNATLAWLGGGSLATGGLGMAGGTAVLGGLVAGPILAIGGAVMAAKAAETKDKAYEELMRIRGNIKELEIVISKLNAIETYTNECLDTFSELLDIWENKLLKDLEILAKRNVIFKELSEVERQVVYANYEMNYLIGDFIREAVMNEDGDDSLPEEQRKALAKSKNLEYINY